MAAKPPKDTKWSWVVLFVVTFVLILEVGTIKTFSVLLPDLKEQLSSKTWVIGSCISIISGWGCVLGLTGDALEVTIGARSCLILSGIFTCIGLIICASANNVHILLLGLILTGCLVLEMNIAVGMVPVYFEKYYNIAVNIYMFGVAMGIIVAPLISQMLLDIYGWRGTILLICGINMHSIPFGALLHHNERNKQNQDKICLISSNENSLNRPTLLHIPLQAITTIMESLKLDLIASPPFMARVLLPSIIIGYTFSSWVIYIVSFALSNGATLMQSALVSTSGGIGMAVINIFLPYLNTVLSYKQLMYISSVTMAVTFALLSISDNVAGMIIVSFTFGIEFSILSTESYIAARDVAKEEEFVSAIAWKHLFYGFAMIAGGTLTGLIFDTTKSFFLSFIVLSAVSLLTAASLGIEDICTKNDGLLTS